MKRMRSFVKLPCFLRELRSLNCPKKCIFCNFADINKEPKPVKAIDIYPSKSSHYTLSENDIVYRGLNHRS